MRLELLAETRDVLAEFGRDARVPSASWRLRAARGRTLSASSWMRSYSRASSS